jgi:hypothetical protein
MARMYILQTCSGLDLGPLSWILHEHEPRL